MENCNNDILKCLNESVESGEFDSLIQVLDGVEKQFGLVLDTDIDDNGEGEFFFDTNYRRETFETEAEANDFENKYQEEMTKWCRNHGYVCNRSEDEDAPLSFWISKKTDESVGDNIRNVDFAVEWDCDDENCDLDDKFTAKVDFGDINIADDEAVQEFLSDWLSDEYGFAHKGFSYKIQSLNEDSETDEYCKKIEQILKDEFDGKVVFNYSKKDLTSEFKVMSWQNLPSEFDLEDKIEAETGKEVVVIYDRYNDKGEIDDDGETISVFVNPVVRKTNESNATREERKILFNKQEEIKSILEDKFKGYVIFDFGSQDIATDFLVSLNSNTPSESEIKDAIKEKLDVDVKVTYLHKDENDKDRNKVLTVCIDFPDKHEDYWDISISHDGTSYSGQIATIDNFERAKRACNYYNKHSKRFAGKFVIVKDGKIIYDKDGERN